MQQIQHLEAMGDKWFPFLNSLKELDGVLSTIVSEGGTRPAWQLVEGEKETILMAYPADSFVRAAALLTGKVEGKLNPVSVMPLLEGLGNELTIMATHPWKSKLEGEILAQADDIQKSFWFYNPLYFRDKAVLEKDTKHIFVLSGLCFGARRALLDEMTITQGGAYEEYCAEYLAENPDKTRIDVPPLKISLNGMQMISLGERACEYQARVVVAELNSFMFGPKDVEQKIYSFVINLGTNDNPLLVMLYAPASICLRGYELKEGDELDIYFWLQGRIAD